MDDLADFEYVFGSNPNLAYDEEIRRKILQNRRILDNELFIDRLLKALGITKVAKLYPPESNQDLKRLHSHITSSSSPDHHKHSVLYYLLRDVSTSHRLPEDFAKTSYLPAKYKTFIDGVWYLDRTKFERALDYLTEPSLVPTFPEEILYTLCRHSPTNDISLPVAYYHTVQPCIQSSKVIEAYFLMLCRANLTEAFFFSRAQGGLNHRALFEKLITFVHSKSVGEDRALKGVELIGLTLDQEEAIWFNDFLTHDSGNRLSGAADTLIMRGIATGQSDINTQQRRLASNRTIDGINWATLTSHT